MRQIQYTNNLIKIMDAQISGDDDRSTYILKVYLTLFALVAFTIV